MHALAEVETQNSQYFCILLLDSIYRKHAKTVVDFYLLIKNDNNITIDIVMKSIKRM